MYVRIQCSSSHQLHSMAGDFTCGSQYSIHFCALARGERCLHSSLQSFDLLESVLCLPTFSHSLRLRRGFPRLTTLVTTWLWALCRFAFHVQNLRPPNALQCSSPSCRLNLDVVDVNLEISHSLFANKSIPVQVLLLSLLLLRTLAKLNADPKKQIETCCHYELHKRNTCFSASPFALLSMLPFEQPQMTNLNKHGNCFEMLGPFQRPMVSLIRWIIRDHQYPSCICSIIPQCTKATKGMNDSILFELWIYLQMIVKF